MIELSLNEAETLAAKAARGAGFAWGLADDIGRAARGLAREGGEWAAALLALFAQAPDFAPPNAGGAPLCPVRMAALLNDAPPEAETLALSDIGLPIWLEALLRPHGVWRVEGDLAAARADVTLKRGVRRALATARRATIAPADHEALGAYAARLYVPESDRSRRRGAGGGRVDDE